MGFGVDWRLGSGLGNGEGNGVGPSVGRGVVGEGVGTGEGTGVDRDEGASVGNGVGMSEVGPGLPVGSGVGTGVVGRGVGCGMLLTVVDTPSAVVDTKTETPEALASFWIVEVSDPLLTAVDRSVDMSVASLEELPWDRVMSKEQLTAKSDRLRASETTKLVISEAFTPSSELAMADVKTERVALSLKSLADTLPPREREAETV